MRKHVLLYGLLAGLLIASLQFIEYRWVGLLFALGSAAALSRRRKDRRGTTG